MKNIDKAIVYLSKRFKTFRQRLDECDLKKVFKHIQKKDSKNAAKCDRPTFKQVRFLYSRVVRELLSKLPTKPLDTPILIKKSVDWYDKTSYTEVVFLNPKYVKPPKGDYDFNDDKYNEYFAMGFVPWSNLIDTPIINQSGLTWDEAIAETLWELTFYGWTEKRADDKKKEIMGRIKEAAKEIKEGKCTKIPPEKKGQRTVVIPDSVIKQIKEIANKL